MCARALCKTQVSHAYEVPGRFSPWSATFLTFGSHGHGSNAYLQSLGSEFLQENQKEILCVWQKMDAAVERLKTGFEKFKTEVYDKKPEVFEPLKAGQAPKYMVFACSDSRVCPSVTLGLEPGEAFTVRNIASMVPPYDKNKYSGVGSAIEYAVCALKVGVIVVIGHSRCGGIKALLSLQDGAPDAFHFVEDWVRIGFPAKKKVQTECASLPFDDQCGVLEKAAVNTSLENLKTYPFVTEGLANGTLKLVGAHYDFVSGKFDTWEN